MKEIKHQTFKKNSNKQNISYSMFIITEIKKYFTISILIAV